MLLYVSKRGPWFIPNTFHVHWMTRTKCHQSHIVPFMFPSINGTLVLQSKHKPHAIWHVLLIQGGCRNNDSLLIMIQHTQFKNYIRNLYLGLTIVPVTDEQIYKSCLKTFLCEDILATLKPIAVQLHMEAVSSLAQIYAPVSRHFKNYRTLALKEKITCFSLFPKRRSFHHNSFAIAELYDAINRVRCRTVTFNLLFTISPHPHPQKSPIFSNCNPPIWYVRKRYVGIT